MQNHINQNYLNNAVDAIRWYRPESENEFKLIELLRDALALQNDIDQLQSDKEELQAELESMINALRNLTETTQWALDVLDAPTSCHARDNLSEALDTINKAKGAGK